MNLETLEQCRVNRLFLYEEAQREIKQVQARLEADREAVRELDILIRHAKFVEGFAKFDQFDWPTLLDNAYAKNREDANAAREALKTCAPEMSQSYGSCWNDIDQYVIAPRIFRDDPYSAKDWALFIDKILPFVKETTTASRYSLAGIKRFKISIEPDVTLWFMTSSSTWSLVSNSFSSYRVVKDFLTVEEATAFIGGNYGDPDRYNEFSKYHDTGSD